MGPSRRPRCAGLLVWGALAAACVGVARAQERESPRFDFERSGHFDGVAPSDDLVHTAAQVEGLALGPEAKRLALRILEINGFRARFAARLAELRGPRRAGPAAGTPLGRVIGGLGDPERRRAREGDALEAELLRLRRDLVLDARRLRQVAAVDLARAAGELGSERTIAALDHAQATLNRLLSPAEARALRATGRSAPERRPTPTPLSPAERAALGQRFPAADLDALERSTGRWGTLAQDGCCGASCRGCIWKSRLYGDEPRHEPFEARRQRLLRTMRRWRAR